MIVRINQVMVTIPIRTTFGAGGFFNPKNVTFPLSAMWAPGNLKYMLSCCLFRLSNLSASLRVRKRTSRTSGDCRGADYLRIMKGEPGGGVRFLHWWCWLLMVAGWGWELSLKGGLRKYVKILTRTYLLSKLSHLKWRSCLAFTYYSSWNVTCFACDTQSKVEIERIICKKFW